MPPQSSSPRAVGVPAARVSIVLAGGPGGAALSLAAGQLLAVTPGAELVLVDGHPGGGSGWRLAGSRRVRQLRICSPLGMAALWNAGASIARGEVLMFAGPRLLAARGWVAALTAELAQPAVGAAGPAVTPPACPGARIAGLTWASAALDARRLRHREAGPQPVPLLTGHCLALRREVFGALGGFDTALLRRGGAAAELCLRLWRYGFQCRVAAGPGVTVQPAAGPADQPADQADLHDRLRLGTVHLAEARLAQLVDALGGRPAFAAAMARVADGDAGQRRAVVRDRAIHDDAWFLDRFAVTAFCGAQQPLADCGGPP